MKSIAVIGGGITGVTSAYALAKRGYQVTLFEKQRYAAMETSFANGGQLSAFNAEVWTYWATIFKGMKWMLKKDAPLLVNPKPSWHKLSWFAEFVAAIPEYERNTTETARLAIAARELLLSWAADEQIDFDLQQKGILHIYRDKSGFDHALTVSKFLSQGGLVRETLSSDEIQAIEPALKGHYYGGFLTPSDFTGDIHKYTQGLALACERLGVVCRYNQDVCDVKADASGVTVMVNEAGDTLRHQFDALVVSAGVGSRKIAAALGDRVNIYPVKGYSITVNLKDKLSQDAAPQISLLDDETKLVSSRLGEERLRVAGTAEFNGYNKDIRADRIKPLVDWVNQCFPDVSTSSVVPWAGLRPMMPNMMPKVGRGRWPGVFYNTGHGHLGWTLSAVTADMIASIIDSTAENKTA